MGFSLRFHDVLGLSGCFVEVTSLFFRGLSWGFHGVLMGVDEKQGGLYVPLMVLLRIGP